MSLDYFRKYFRFFWNGGAFSRFSPESHISDSVHNFARGAHRRRAHEPEWPQIREADGETHVWDPVANQPELDSELVRQAFWDMLLPFLETLSPNQCEYFLRHYLQGEPVAGIARSAGKTTHAVEQSLFRSRKKLRAELESKGLSYGVLREHLTPPRKKYARLIGMKARSKKRENYRVCA